MPDVMITNLDVIKMFNKTRPFKNEKELQDFLWKNMDHVCRDLFNDELVTFETESYLGESVRFGSPKVHADFFITGKKNHYIIECKCPTNIQRELNRGISQVLDYICIAESNLRKTPEAWIITSSYHNSLHTIINRFKLPINICVLNRENQGVFRHGF